ncbi:hypothetical protein H7I53_24875 [Mycolicibacterium pulveris]|uniref:Putative lipoprotein LppK n=1 Tax=Mycolicibacterium pulveris TaxID=36813 RepID=A0A7I7UPB6_MYCPV|nr:hypothetical protein [Mycolicibacterium pulveris]MCV6983437.1 hypothetical protein [Mycolicibacterium pulveris]BBY83314.1 putative lipoprotein LppK [Mycolicibacterium pulveris]
MHRTARFLVLGAVAIAAALGLGACGADDPSPPAASETLPPITKPPTVPSEPDPAAAPLPPDTALTDVIYRLADPAVPGVEKLNLVQHATPDDAAALDKFARALADGGFAPLTVEAHDMSWSQGEPGGIVARIVIKPADPQAGEFAFPMEFSPAQDSWQLTRQTADVLLYADKDPSPTPTR